MSIKFRELIQPGSNYEFVGKSKLFLTISAILILGSIALLPINAMTRGSMLNWTIDFKGGTELIMGFSKPVQAADVRSAIEGAGHKNVEVSSYGLAGGLHGYIVRLPEFGAVKASDANATLDELEKKFADRGVLKATWQGERLLVRSEKAFTPEELEGFLKTSPVKADVKWPEGSTAESRAAEFAQVEEGTGEYNYDIAVHGLDRIVLNALTAKVDPQAKVIEVNAVGAKAGKDLRNNAIMSMLYAIALIMLYIAFRFDFRYGPGTVVSLLHDAIVVIGVFALTWTEFSLTTVAAVLTVIGYSMNDTVVVFDRIRENEGKLKDKKLDRVINISINETLSRTLLTSVATFVTTLAMNVLGTGLVRNFAFAMNIGIIIGTYSSIFIAAPVMLALDKRGFAKAAAKRVRPATSEA